MAKNDDDKQAPKASEAKVTEKKDKAPGSMLVWIVVIVMTVVGGGGGFFIANIIAFPEAEKQAELGPDKVPTNEEMMQELLSGDSNEAFDYALEPVIACLDEPSLSRYVRATIIIRMEEGFDPIKGSEFLNSKKYLLNDWMTTYLAGLTLVQVQGSRNLERVKMEMFEQFNQLLFPNKKPMVKKILFKEFVVN